MVVKMVTANRLGDGVVVFRRADGTWSERLEDGEMAEGKEAGTALLEAAEASVADRTVVGPYLIDVITCEDGIRPSRFREAIRASGPTVPSDFRPVF